MEESINFVNGYGKVNPSDDETTSLPAQSPPSNRRKSIAVIVSLLFFVAIVAATIGATVVHHRRSKPSESQSSSVKTTDSIKAVCAVTPHPESCFTEISSIDSDNNAVDPEIIFNLTLRLAVNELSNISSLPKTLISRSNDLRTGSALRDCATLFDDALSQLRQSVESMRVGTPAGEEKVVLTEGKLGDLKTWISAAMTDQETCVDGLEEMGSTAVDEVKMRVQRSNEYMSNSLAILANIETLLDKFGLHLH
ncbi:hypothetical protein L6452_38512 [Arctium lappa]|uniref:Uncharacterized protein n=1 Tax=Arctium lappa TaxID=4217 RepID=A0ACB8XQW6_ARCLA|nr:hypothetical protein L6452_38512 [Arctium lappa]